MCVGCFWYDGRVFGMSGVCGMAGVFGLWRVARVVCVDVWRECCMSYGMCMMSVWCE